MKEDILEQIVEDWLVSEPGWFVKHNIKFRPSKTHQDYNSKQDSVHSDIDILAISGVNTGLERVRVVTCKSWQGGFNPKKTLEVLERDANYHQPSEKFQKREEWKQYRELVSEKWMNAFVDRVELETGQRDFEYFVAVTKLQGKLEDREAFMATDVIRKRFQKCHSIIELKIVTLEDMVLRFQDRLQNSSSSVPESTEVGRILQLMNASGLFKGSE